MKSVIITFISMSLFFVACSNRDRQLMKEIEILQSKMVHLPSMGLIMQQGSLSKNSIVSKKGYKLIVYADSVDCTSCAINHIDLWGSFIDYAKQSNEQIRFYFIFSPRKKEIPNTKLMLANTKFNYPVILDTLREFEKLNPHLPKNGALHTFLLDENNNVVLVGNPLQNKKIKEMFYNIVRRN